MSEVHYSAQEFKFYEYLKEELSYRPEYIDLDILKKRAGAIRYIIGGGRLEEMMRSLNCNYMIFLDNDRHLILDIEWQKQKRN